MATVIPDTGAGFQKVFATLINDSNDLVDIDSKHMALDTINIAHHEVHEGEMYEVSKITYSLADDTFIYLGLETPAEKECHINISADAGGDADLFIYESTSHTGGEQLTIYNLNRSSSNNASSTAIYNPTIVSTATTIFSTFLAGGAKKLAGGGSVEAGAEWVFKKGTKYLIGLINRGGAAKDNSIELEWYEVDV